MCLKILAYLGIEGKRIYPHFMHMTCVNSTFFGLFIGMGCENLVLSLYWPLILSHCYRKLALSITQWELITKVIDFILKSQVMAILAEWRI